MMDHGRSRTKRDGNSQRIIRVGFELGDVLSSALMAGLARTIDALTERVSPRNAARRVLVQAREQAARPEVQRAAAGAVAALVALGVAGYLIRRRRK